MDVEEFVNTEIQICSRCSWGDNELLNLKSETIDKTQDEAQAYFELCPECGSSTIWIEIETSSLL